jgi:voltage-gated potassium channel
MDIKRIVEDNDTKAGRLFDLVIQFLIVLSLVTFSISTLPDLSESTHQILYGIEVVTVIIFSLEYILRILVADQKLKYIFSFYGIVDLIAILPFYINRSVDLRSIRVIRLLRLFRMLCSSDKCNSAVF